MILSASAAWATEPSPAARETGANQHWAFNPIGRSPLPAVRSRDWPQTSVDYFILAKLEEKGLTPAPVADKRTLIRRATFDLTGLPPTRAEVDAFLNDVSSEAFARVV